MYASQSSISATAEAYIGFTKPTDGILTQLFRNCRPIIKQKQKIYQKLTQQILFSKQSTNQLFKVVLSRPARMLQGLHAKK